MYTGVVTVTGDSGFHYVLLIDADTYLARYQDEVFATNGSYAYNFPSVEEGNYIVFAGTDSDNDFFIGDAGESSGAYISLDQPIIIRVEKNLSGIDFITSFNIDLPVELSTGTATHKSGVKRMRRRNKRMRILIFRYFRFLLFILLGLLSSCWPTQKESAGNGSSLAELLCNGVYGTRMLQEPSATWITNRTSLELYIFRFEQTPIKR